MALLAHLEKSVGTRMVFMLVCCLKMFRVDGWFRVDGLGFRDEHAINAKPKTLNYLNPDPGNPVGQRIPDGYFRWQLPWLVVLRG